jgi:monothiol glutaredoxin
MNNPQEKIKEVVEHNKVVLFMKGTRTAPQCGFSARVVGVLDEYIDDYETVDVLADPGIRSGIKAFSDWPTIPQLYINGEFVGGCDITLELGQSGELGELLGASRMEIPVPKVTLSSAAAAELGRHVPEDGSKGLRVDIAADWQHGIGLGPERPDDITVKADGLTLYFDRASAKRADGLNIDFGSDGFDISNPNEPKVEQMSVSELKKLMDDDAAMKIFDVRSPSEAATAKIDGTTLLDDMGRKYLLTLPKDTKLVFHCHHGGRSQRAAEFFAQQGYKDVHNLAGGIDAWAAEIDSSIARY